mmetsp:Transcript_29913/g.67895  ORF Transcript_29913/g.67895 Transcript_29913/m.67895 type:complete len:278 (-) Transcript_29913:330-1163(-)
MALQRGRWPCARRPALRGPWRPACSSAAACCWLPVPACWPSPCGRGTARCFPCKTSPPRPRPAACSTRLSSARRCSSPPARQRSRCSGPAACGSRTGQRLQFRTLMPEPGGCGRDYYCCLPTAAAGLLAAAASPQRLPACGPSCSHCTYCSTDPSPAAKMHPTTVLLSASTTATTGPTPAAPLPGRGSTSATSDPTYSATSDPSSERGPRTARPAQPRPNTALPTARCKPPSAPPAPPAPPRPAQEQTHCLRVAYHVSQPATPEPPARCRSPADPCP